MSEFVSERSQSGLRLRRPERSQVALSMQCPDDLVSADHPVRVVMAVVGKLDLSRFHDAIKARSARLAGTRPTLTFWWRCGCTAASAG